MAKRKPVVSAENDIDSITEPVKARVKSRAKIKAEPTAAEDRKAAKAINRKKPAKKAVKKAVKKKMKVKRGAKKTKALSRKAEEVVPKKNLAKKPAKVRTKAVIAAAKKKSARKRTRASASAPAPARRKPIQREVRLTVERQFTKDGEVVDMKTDDEKLDVRVFATEPAVVTLKYGLTLNFGNFEGCRLDVGLAIPCYLEERDAAYESASKWVGERIEKERDEIRAHKQKLFTV